MIDNAVLEFMSLIENDFLTFLMKIFSFIGSVCGITVVLVCFFIFSKSEYKNKFILNTLIITLINNVVKLLIGRQRPISALVDESFFSFPSGHAMVGSFVFGFLIWFILKKTKLSNFVKTVSAFLLSTTLFLICFSRLYLMAHYFTDVLVGCLFSLIYLIVFINIEDNKIKILKSF